MPKKIKGLKKKLPNKILVLGNADKDGWHESWTPGRNLLNIPHPFRAVFLGPPGSGKTNLIFNCLIFGKPNFEELIVIHGDPEYTKEYQHCMNEDGDNVKILGSIPAPSEFEGDVKTLVVLDDLNFKGMNKLELKNLDRLLGFVSTHKKISVIVCSQDAFQVPSNVRRMSNLFVLWRMRDLDSMSAVARKSGIKGHELRSMFNQLCKHPKDSLWLDFTDFSPAPLRLNGFDIIKKKVNGKSSQKEIDDEDQYGI